MTIYYKNGIGIEIKNNAVEEIFELHERLNRATEYMHKVMGQDVDEHFANGITFCLSILRVYGFHSEKTRPIIKGKY